MTWLAVLGQVKLYDDVLKKLWPIITPGLIFFKIFLEIILNVETFNFRVPSVYVRIIRSVRIFLLIHAAQSLLNIRKFKFRLSNILEKSPDLCLMSACFCVSGGPAQAELDRRKRSFADTEKQVDMRYKRGLIIWTQSQVFYLA